MKVRGALSQAEASDIVDVLRSDGVICIKTDTVYGLSCASTSGEAVGRIARLKGSEKPVLLLVADASWVAGLATEVPESAEELMRLYWPGPLTLVLRAGQDVPRWARGARDTVAVRCPASETCRRLSAELGCALVSTSANVSGEEPCLSGLEAARRFLEEVDLVVDSGKAPTSRPSTIVDVTLSPPTLVRTGAVRIDVGALSRLGRA
ncbi:MAG: L-threonylcarbamoyladenylate synthase [Candidatus Eisenbacteria bacterium]